MNNEDKDKKRKKEKLKVDLDLRDYICRDMFYSIDKTEDKRKKKKNET